MAARKSASPSKSQKTRPVTTSRTPAKAGKPARPKTPAKASRSAQVSKPKKSARPAKTGKRRPKVDAEEVASRLASAIPEPRHELTFHTPFELLTATILAAQSTDKTVNQVMPTLLARFPDAQALARADQEEVEALVKRTGFFRNKAKAIRATAQQLVTRHDGEVPDTMEALTALSGVARKTANVVLGSALGIQAGFVVDTHVARVAQRLGLSLHDDPVRIESDLCARFPTAAWTEVGHRFTLHGRYTCLARTPLCSDCPVNELCRSRQSEPLTPWQERAMREAARVEQGMRASQSRSP